MVKIAFKSHLFEIIYVPINLHDTDKRRRKKGVTLHSMSCAC